MEKEKFKLKLPDSHYREDGSIRDYKKVYDDSGRPISLVEEVHYLPPQKVKVKWYNYKGEPVDDSSNDDVPAYMFEIEAEGIDSSLVRRVEFPDLDYASHNKAYLVKIVTNILED